MALVIFTPKIDVGISGWLFDVITTENLTSNASVTSYGVERGADISDHIRVEPKKFSLSGIVSATPTDPERQYPDRLQDVLQDLLALQSAEQLHQLVCVFGIIDNLAITSVSASYDVSANGDVLSLDIELQEVRFAQAERVRIVELRVDERKADIDPNTQGFITNEQGQIGIDLGGSLTGRFEDPFIREQLAKEARIEEQRKQLEEKIFDDPDLPDADKQRYFKKLKTNPNTNEIVTGSGSLNAWNPI